MPIGPESVCSEDIFSNETMVLFIHDLWVLVKHRCTHGKLLIPAVAIYTSISMVKRYVM